MDSMLVDFTTLSTKGQVVLPKSFRELLSIDPGTQMVVMSDGVNILMKPIRQPELSEFSSLMDAAKDWASEVGMVESDIDDAVKAVRKNKRRSE